MSNLSRSAGLKIAAVVVLMLTLVNLVMFQIPDLMAGMEAVNQVANADQGPPFFMVLFGFVLDILAFVAAYGAWTEQRWGVILLIVISAFNCLMATAGALFLPVVSLRILGVVMVILYLSAIYLCLRREPKSLVEAG